MIAPARFPFVTRRSGSWRVPMPVVPIELRTDVGSVRAMALLDTGAMIGVLPYELGLLLGMRWHEQTTELMVTGNLRHEARMVRVETCIAEFKPIRIAFAWVQSEHAPVILGQVNFFHAFDVNLQASRRQFEILLSTG